MTLNFFGCFNVSGIKTQPTSETVDYEMNVTNKPYINGNALVGDKLWRLRLKNKFLRFINGYRLY